MQPGTAIDNTPAGEPNPTYDDLLAIWDGYNGTSTGTWMTGTPSGWQANHYWSATPYGYGHVDVYLYDGSTYNYDDWNNVHVALEVL